MDRITVYPISLGRSGRREILNAHYPLGCLVAYAKFVDSGRLRDDFDFAPVTPMRSDEIGDLIQKIDWNVPSVFLLSSYVWNHPINVDFAAEVRRRSPDSLVVVGGPQIPRRSIEALQFFSECAADVAVRNEGELTLVELLSVIASSRDRALREVDFRAVAGITARGVKGDVYRTAERERINRLEEFPSPYTTGEYDHWIEGSAVALLETNRGCPYGCTFCDWGAATLSKIHKTSLDRVIAEIDFFGRHHIDTIHIIDANFGILPRDVDITRELVRARERNGYPKQVYYSNAKTATTRLGDVAKLLYDAGMARAGLIAMQTVDKTTLENVERANIRNEEYEKIISFYRRERIPVVSDMMIGLPGQTYATCKADLQFLFDRQVTAAIAATSVMPNAPMADVEYQRKFRLVVDSKGLVESTYSFTRAEYDRITELCLAYKFFVKCAVGKYLLYYLQLDHGILAVDLIEEWVHGPHRDKYPLSRKLRNILTRGLESRGRTDWMTVSWGHADGAVLLDEPEAFLRDVIALCADIGVRLEGTDVEALIRAQAAVLPHMKKTFPSRVPLSHDVPAYFAQIQGTPCIRPRVEGLRPLRDFGPGSLVLPEQPVTETYAFADLNQWAADLELRSSLNA